MGEPVTSRTTTHADGSVDLVQSIVASSDETPAGLERLYWSEVRHVTLGLVRFRDDAIRLFGVWPNLIRFAPAIGAERPIVGGIFVRRAQGTMRWSSDGGRIVVAVERFAPRLRGPFWRAEFWFHGVVGRRFLARAARSA